MLLQIVPPPAKCGYRIVAAFVISMAGHVQAQSHALSVPVDATKWIGYDGSWSPFTLGIGTQQQGVDLLPSTSGQETLVVGVSGCDGTVQCETLRGGLFAANESSTFQSIGDYNLGLDFNLGYSGAGYYGLDVISLSNELSLKNQVLGIVNSTQYWIGYLGLGVSNTTIGASTVTSFLSTLASGEYPQIPGQSFAYTAGASYQLKQVPASLTLGGYDANRFNPNNVSFTLDSNQQPTLGLSSITMSGASGGNVTVLGPADHGLFTIDSTTPFLWLPENAANTLGKALGLVYNDTLNVFLYPNTSLYENLYQSPLSFDFTFCNTPGSPDALTLTIGGQAFTSQNLSFGFPGLTENSSAAPLPYFPVRKAANSTQYKIGRTFLQEAYLIVDYDRNNFSISQAVFSEYATTEVALVDINSPNFPAPSGTSSGPLSTGAIIGIAVVAVIIVTLLICGTAVFLLRRHYAKEVLIRCPGDPPPPKRTGIARLLLGQPKWVELPANEDVPSGNAEQIHWAFSTRLLDEKGGVPIEAFSNEIRELPAAVEALIELQGSPVNVAQHATRRHTPLMPVELPDRSSSDHFPSPLSTGDGMGTFLTGPSETSTEEHQSPTSSDVLSPLSPRSVSAKSSTPLMPNPTSTTRSGPRRQGSADRSHEEQDASENMVATEDFLMSGPTMYTIDDSVNRAFDLRQLRVAPKASRRKFSFGDENDAGRWSS